MPEPPPTTAILLSIGSELVSGLTVDTNTAHLAVELGRLGVACREHRTVGDELSDIAAAIREAADRADIVIVTGGLGPTADDLTRQALAAAMGVELELHEPSLRHIQEFFRRRDRKMIPANRVQAMVPAGAEAIENPRGTAPGIAAQVGDAQVFVTPGVPQEMRGMFAEQIAPRIRRGQGVIVHRVLHTFGSGESDIADRIRDLMSRDANPTIGTTVAAGMVSVRMTARAKSSDAADALLAPLEKEIRKRLGERVVGVDDLTMHRAVGLLLGERELTLATAESCTGGLLGKMITDQHGSSKHYLGGVVAYCNDLKHELLGVDNALFVTHGAVSEPVARAMAAGCRERLGSDYALSITGIAGPTGGTEQKPVGLVYIGLAGPRGVQVIHQIFPGTRDLVRLRSAMAAMNLLRLELLRSAPKR